MADRVHPMPSPSSPLPPPPGRQRSDYKQQQQESDAAFSADDADADLAAAPATETTPLHPSFFHDHRALSPPPGTYIIQVPKDQVLREPPPDRARRYKKLAGRPARRRRLRRACCLSCAALLVVLLAAAAFVGAVCLVFRPRAPSFSVPSLAVRGLDAAALASPPAAGLSPGLDAAVRADNGRNRKTGVEYRAGGDVAVSYAGQRLAAGPWPAFRQAARNVTVVAVAMRGQGVRFTDAQRRQLAAERAAGAVPLTVEARVPVRLRFGKVIRTWTVDVKARCEVAVDRLDGNATAVNRGCKVKVKPLWWWW